MTMRTYIPLIIGVVLLLAAGALYGATYYMLTGWDMKAQTLASEADQKSAELDQTQLAHAELGTLSNETATLDQYTVDKSDIVPFLQTLQATGGPLGATVN